MNPISSISVIQVIFAVGCAIIAERRGGQPLVWFILGLIFGPIAFIITLTGGKQCPHCFSWIPERATICRECKKEAPLRDGQKYFSLFEKIKTGGPKN